MKKLLLLISIFSAFLAVNNGSIAQSILNPNGGFEEAEVGASTVDPWFFGKASGQAEFTVIDSVAHSGSKSLLLNVIEKATGNFWDIQAVYEHIPTVPGTYYRATFWARSTSGYTLRAAIGTYDYVDLASATVTLTNKWSRVSMVCYNEDKEELRIPINQFEQGMYFFDDVSFIESPIGGSVVLSSGDTIVIQALTNLEQIPDNFDVNSFTVTVNGTINPVKKVALNTSKTNYFYLIMTNKIAAGDQVIIDHTGGKIFYYNTTLAPDDNIIAFTDTAYNESKYIVGINQVNSSYEKLAFTPNPVKDHIRLLQNTSYSIIEVYTIQGKLVKQIQQPVGNIVNVDDLTSGMYIIKATSKEGKQYSAKLLKY